MGGGGMSEKGIGEVSIKIELVEEGKLEKEREKEGQLKEERVK